MSAEHWFWSLLMIMVMVWYSTITVYVSVKGTRDIRSMLGRLKKEERPPSNS